MEIERGCLAVKIDGLAANGAVPAHCADDAVEEEIESPSSRRQLGVRPAQHSVRLVQQSNRRENGQIFGESPVQRGLAASQLRIVHRWQIIEDERGGVNHLEGRGSEEKFLPRATTGL